MIEERVGHGKARLRLDCPGKVEDRQRQLLWSSDPEGVEEAASKGFVKVIS